MGATRTAASVHFIFIESFSANRFSIPRKPVAAESNTRRASGESVDGTKRVKA